MTPIFWIAGAAVLLFALSGNSSSQKHSFVEGIVEDGPEGESDAYSMMIDAIGAGVSPFDEDVLFVFYNDSMSASDPQLRADINASAKEAGIKSVNHVYGPANGYPWARHYSQGKLVDELPADASADGLVDWIDAKGVASAGRPRAIAVAGSPRQVVSVAGRKAAARASGSNASKHMMPIARASGAPWSNPSGAHKSRTVQARHPRRRSGYTNR